MKKTILLHALFLCALQIQAQTISGIAFSATDSVEIPGVNVSIKGTYSGTFTDGNGQFKLNYGKKDTVILLLSFIGFDDREIVINSGENKQHSIYLKPATYQKDEAVVAATRANRNTATAYSDIDAATIETRNFGQDIPYLLELEPSVVVTSDAGAGVGYTGIRIRGTDPTRINVTLNGIPVNDSESHGVWWVNMPDLSSSVDNIQVQRGVGTSSNGAAAFGASINMQTNTLKAKPYVTLKNGYGSFNTWRHTIAAGSGLIANRFTLDARVSRISSDGYIDRATSELMSIYASAAYHGKKTLIRFNVISGSEETYQAWYGTPEDSLETNRTYNFYTYENEVDNYRQANYQLLFSHQFDKSWTFNLNGHYTRGKGYFEQFREKDDFVDYGLQNVIIENDTISSADIIRRRWLDNHFYGFTFSLGYNSGKRFSATFGGAWNQYLGKHFGEVIGTEFVEYESIQKRYYEDDARKSDINMYLRGNYYLHPKVNLFADLQHRTIEYRFVGPFAERSGDVVVQEQLLNWYFFNPKIGINYEVNSRNRLYTSFAMANREPARKDLVESTQLTRPKNETLYDWELGYERRTRNYSVGLNAYWMLYKDQLVLTGAINDVGAYTSQNVDWSDRYGLELTWSFRILKKLKWAGNFTWSQSKIWDFTEFVDDSDTGIQQQKKQGMTDISFSPNYIVASEFNYEPIKNLNIALITKYVGEQFLDNTSNRDRMLNDYLLNNIRLSYNFSWKFFKEIGIAVQLNNILNAKYESNGYTFSYSYEEEKTTENFYYPQARFNFMTMLTVKF
ncbi:MAG: TonB-dependent receptor [Flavobacteriales bacterium]|nr:TonB-dependent receptor [Flavobacteriales bacterium]